MANWKRTELALAKRLGGKRSGPTGRTGSDIIHAWLAIECKEKKQLPKWLKAAMRQSVNAARSEQLPIVVLHELNSRHDEDLVCRHYIAFEIDPETAERARERVANTQPPLPGLNVEQLPLGVS